MTQPRKILWFVFSVAVLLLLLPLPTVAQNYVTPVVKPTPQGQLIVVNNVSGANHSNPHVDGDLVCYTDQPSIPLTTVRYHNLATAGSSNFDPNPINNAATVSTPVTKSSPED